MTAIQDYRSSLDDARSRRYGTFSYLPEMDGARLRTLVDYIIARGWTPAIEHSEPEHAAGSYWYMWKLPLFGERAVDAVLDEVNACHREHPGHMIRLMGYDNRRQTQGTCVTIHRPAHRPGA